MKPTAEEADGIMLCNGPSLENDWACMDVIFKMRVVIAVNFSIERVRFKNDYCVYFLKYDPSGPLFRAQERHPDKDKLKPLKWQSKPRVEDGSHRRMEAGDPEHLVCLGFTMFTAINFLVAMGCKTIVGCGVDLKPWPDGSYNNGGGRNGDYLFNEIKGRFELYTRPDLKRLGVKFWSRALQEGT